MLLVAVAYPVIGIVTADLARLTTSPVAGLAWRWAAWVLSLVVFVGHNAYEQVRLGSAVRSAAAHTAAAVAAGAFALAAAGPVRSHWGATDFWRVSMLSLPLWPLLAGTPAFLAALAAGPILRRLAVRHRPV